MDMIFNKPLLILLLASIYACKSESPDAVNSRKIEAEKPMLKVYPTKIFFAEITGMTCEHGCGGAIRTNLKATGGVSKVEYDFVENAEKQVCRIYFDEGKVSSAEIKKLVGTINKKQFSIKTLSESDLAEKK